MKDYISVYDNAIDSKVCDDLVKFFEDNIEHTFIEKTDHRKFRELNLLIFPEKEVEITNLIVQSRADGVNGLNVYSIVHTREEQLLVINEWNSIDAFMDYVNGPHNMIELIEHLCIRLDEENVCKAYSGTIIHQENSSLDMMLTI